jgi:hypothetical protein
MRPEEATTVLEDLARTATDLGYETERLGRPEECRLVCTGSGTRLVIRFAGEAATPGGAEEPGGPLFALDRDGEALAPPEETGWNREAVERYLNEHAPTRTIGKPHTS